MGLQHGPRGVLGVGDHTQAEAGKVFLFPFRGEFHRPGGPPHENRQNAGGHGVQGAGVADPSLPEKSPELGNHIVAGPAGGFVDD